MRSYILVLLPALALALTGCKKESLEGPFPGCRPANAGAILSACVADADCCSFGCEFGLCMPNPSEGGMCRANADCAAPRLCIANRCTTAACNAGGACAPGVGAPCCVGACTLNMCATDDPPVAVPGRIPATAQVPWHVAVQLTNASYDPDGGGLTYLWTATGPAPLAFLPSASHPTPVVIPDAVGTYTITLRASSTTLSHEAQISFEAVNAVPIATVDPYMLATTKSRNVPFTFSVPVRDSDGGPVTCAWWKIPPPPAAQDPISVTSATLCAAQTGGPASGSTSVTFSEDGEGIWTLRLVTSDGEPANVRSWDRYVTVVNDPPTVDAMPGRVGNFGAPGLEAPPIPLHAVARDVNGDVAKPYFTYSWKLTATKPGQDSRPSGTVVGEGPDPFFVPSAVGAYQLQLDVDDAHTGGTATAFVDVLVEPYILPLGEVIDAVHDKGTDRIVAVGVAPGGGNRLWVIDPTVPAILHDLALAATPTCVALSADGTEALVGENGGYQRVTSVLTSPTVLSRLRFYVGTTPQAVVASDIVHVGNGHGFAVDTGGNVYLLDLVATADPSGGAASCPGCSGALPGGGNQPYGRRAVATASTLWLLHTNRLSRYAVAPSNGNLSSAVVATPPVSGMSGLWLGAGNTYLFTSTADVFDAATLGSTARLSSARDHVDTTVTAGLKGVSASWASAALGRFDETFADTGALQLPQLGKAGTGYANHGRFAFVKMDESGFFAVVRANTGTPTAAVYEWGLVKLLP